MSTERDTERQRIIASLRDRGRGRGCSAVELADHLEELTGAPLTHSRLLFSFKQAFPEIPLRSLNEASRWHRLGAGPLTDDDLDDLLAPWLGPSRADG